jgi:hypothetical protein
MKSDLSSDASRKKRLQRLLANNPGSIRMLTDTQWKIVDHYLNNSLGDTSAHFNIPVPRVQAHLNRAERTMAGETDPSPNAVVEYEADPLVLRPDLYHVLSTQQTVAGRLRTMGLENKDIANELGMKEASCRRLLGEARKRILEAAAITPGVRREVLSRGNLEDKRTAPKTTTSDLPPKMSMAWKIPKTTLRNMTAVKCDRCGAPIGTRTTPTYALAACPYCDQKFIRCNNCGGKSSIRGMMVSHSYRCPKRPRS